MEPVINEIPVPEAIAEVLSNAIRMQMFSHSPMDLSVIGTFEEGTKLRMAQLVTTMGGFLLIQLPEETTASSAPLPNIFEGASRLCENLELTPEMTQQVILMIQLGLE